MCHLKLRLLVALLTFGLGVGVVSVLNAFLPADLRLEDVPAPQISQPLVRTKATDVRGKRPISGGLLQGKAISKPQPVYPPIAKAARASGTVTLQIIVDEAGQVIKATAVAGHPLLQEAAVAAARQARFSPTLLSGQPVKVSGVITYNFVLQ
jgi:TonB family protein